jgi:hypothetical protein
MATKQEILIEYAISYASTIALALVAAAVFVGLKTFFNLDDVAAGTLASPIVALAMNQIPNSKVNLFNAAYDAFKEFLGEALKKDERAQVDIAAFVEQFWLFIGMVGTFLLAALAFIKSFFPAKKPAYPAWPGVSYIKDTGADAADLSNADFAKIGFVVEQRDLWPLALMTIWYKGKRIASAMFEPARGIVWSLNNDPFGTAPIITGKEYNSKIYQQIKDAYNPVQLVIDLYGKQAKDLLAEGYTEGDGWYWQAVENAVNGNDAQTALDVFCKITGYAPPGPK